jgi:hypothetical protein
MGRASKICSTTLNVEHYTWSLKVVVIVSRLSEVDEMTDCCLTYPSYSSSRKKPLAKNGDWLIVRLNVVISHLSCPQAAFR